MRIGSRRQLKDTIKYAIVGLSMLSLAWAKPDTIEQFIMRVSDQDHFSAAELHGLFANEKPDASILAIEQKPYQKKPWPDFQSDLLTQKRIEDGVQFFNTHKAVLMQAEKTYHVDPFVITAIIGFESNYGTYKGSYEAFNSLYTLGFYYPPREMYFQKQLENILLLARDWHKPVTSIQSSFDGGLGYPQFMPDMYRKIAKPYQAGAFPDLIHNANDSIVSVAYYLEQAHWKPGGFIAKPVDYIGEKHVPDCHYEKRPSYTALQLVHSQFVIPEGVVENKVGCVSLQDKDHTDYWVIGDNFYAIQKYNPQVYYVLVVNALSQAIAKSADASSPNRPEGDR
jgi:membrane-bound lytic murein transglycosylase B